MPATKQAAYIAFMTGTEIRGGVGSKAVLSMEFGALAPNSGRSLPKPIDPTGLHVDPKVLALSGDTRSRLSAATKQDGQRGETSKLLRFPGSKTGVHQNRSSAGTSRRQVPRVFKYLANRAPEAMRFQPGTTNLDLGGGKWDDGTEFLAGRGVTNLVWDPFNRSPEHNASIEARMKTEKFPTVTIANVLNVIAEPQVRDEVIRLAAQSLQAEGSAFFQVYERDGSGQGTETRDGYQTNMKGDAYRSEVEQHFEDVKVLRFGKESALLIATGPKAKPASDMASTASDLEAQARKAGIPGRGKTFGVGKEMGPKVYVHVSSESALPGDAVGTARARAQRELKRLGVKDFEPAVIRFDRKTGEVAFLESPDFDRAHEPTVGRSVLVKPDGKVKLTEPSKDPTIYHHKWTMVAPDYDGFSVSESIARSLRWWALHPDKSRIGRKSYWEAEVLPRLDARDSKAA